MLTRSRIGFWLCASLSAIAMHVAPASAQGLAPGEYKIGFITANTGPIAQAGQSFWAGAQLASEEVKTSKYLGASSIVLEPKEAAAVAGGVAHAINRFRADRSILGPTC